MAIAAGTLVLATLTERINVIVPAAAPTTVAQPAAVAKPAVEFTACVHPGPTAQGGTHEQIEVAVPDGEMTIGQTRGYTWRLQVSDVSDPRVDGTWYSSWDEDEYTLPENEAGPTFAAYTHRIETDEGAWQGSAVDCVFPDGAPRALLS